MLILLGGLIASGKVHLANRLAMLKGMHPYDMSRNKRPQLSFDKRGLARVVQPKTDAEWLSVYEKAVGDFHMLAKMHTDVIIADTFHRKVPRDYLLSEAKKYFDRVVFIWVESGSEATAKRLKRMRSLGILRSVGDGMQRLKAASIFAEFPDASTPRFVSTEENIDAQCDALWEMVNTSSR